MILVHYLHLLRHKGQSIGEIISAQYGKDEQSRLFIIFAYLTLILVVAAFASIVAATFGSNYMLRELLLVRQLRIRNASYGCNGFTCYLL